MTHNARDGGRSDRSRINMNEDYEVQYWTMKFGCTKQQLEAAMKDHVLAEGQLMGTYGR